MSMQINKMCRTCLVSDTPLVPLFNNKTGKNASVIEMLQACNFFAPRQVSTVGMPDKICMGCISEINRAYLFKTKCERSDHTLKQFLEQELSSEEVYDEESILLEQIKDETDEEGHIKIIEMAVIDPANRKSLDDKNSAKNNSTDDGKIVPDNVQEDTMCFDEQQVEEIYEIDELKASPRIGDDYHSYEEQSTSTEFNDSNEEHQDITVLYTMSVDCSNSEIPNSKAQNSKKSWKCPHCPQEFVLSKNFEKHVAKHVRSLKAIEKHSVKMDKHVDEKKSSEMEWEDKEAETVSVKDIIRESEIKQTVPNTSDNPYKCSHCGAGFRLEKSLGFHIKLNRCTEKQFECLVCKKVFISKHNLFLHMKTHTEVFQCSICVKKFDSADKLKDHMDKEHKGNDVRNQCTICKKVFSMLSALKDHMRIHSGEKPFLCSVCGKGFSQNTNLKQHTMRHSKLKPFKCLQCSCEFVSKGELNSHVRKHTGEHPFVCDTCGSGFTTSSSLLKHKRIHTGERPYACDFCPMRFAALGTMKNHRRTHTGEKPFVCKICKRGFSQQSDCAIHMRTHTGERPYICTICGLSFQQSGTMKTHFKKLHAEKEKSLADIKDDNKVKETLNNI